eukprot:3321288-Rhodomonas_salina.1
MVSALKGESEGREPNFTAVRSPRRTQHTNTENNRTHDRTTLQDLRLQTDADNIRQHHRTGPEAGV